MLTATRLVLGAFLSAGAVFFAQTAALADCGPVVIDAGHGGWDSGAVGPTGFAEKTANLDIAIRVRDLLRQNGYTVVMTRETDISPNTPARDLTGDGRINVSDDLQARVNVANAAKATAFVSIHNNSSMSSAAKGSEAYYWSGAGPDSSGGRLAKLIQEEVVARIGLSNRGVMGANFYVLRRTDMASALVEGAFLSNPTEELLLKTPSFRQKLAQGIYNGIRRFVSPGNKSEPGSLRFKLKAKTRTAISLNSYFCDKAVASRVSADRPVMAEKSIYFNTAGRAGGLETKGAVKPGRQWYFAEGYTGAGFDTWLHLVNPTSATVNADIEYFTEDGPPVKQTVKLPGFGRTAVHVNQRVPNKSVAVNVTAGNSIVAERSMFFNYAGRDGGHLTGGIQDPASSWYFAEGFTGRQFDTWVLLFNPNNFSTRAQVTYLTPTGAVSGRNVDIPARTRRSIHVNTEVPNSEVSTIVTAGANIVAERSVYFNYNGLAGGHNSVGARRPAGRWFFAEGTTRPGFTQFLTLMNPNSEPASVAVDYLLAKGLVVSRQKTVPPLSRLTLAVNSAGADGVGANKNVAARLVSDRPIVAERPMYFNYGDYKGGHDSFGAMSLSKRWYFADAVTGPGFESWLVISNPGEREADVKLRFYK